MLVLILTFVLLIVAALHMAWGMGVTWPMATQSELARAVVGTAGITQMPSRMACLSVTLMLLIGVIWLWLPNGLLTQIGLGVMAGVFLLRGIASFIPALQRLAPEEPFATLDRRYYGPLCILLGIGTAIHLLQLMAQISL